MTPLSCHTDPLGQIIPARGLSYDPAFVLENSCRASSRDPSSSPHCTSRTCTEVKSEPRIGPSSVAMPIIENATMDSVAACSKTRSITDFERSSKPRFKRYLNKLWYVCASTITYDASGSFPVRNCSNIDSSMSPWFSNLTKMDNTSAGRTSSPFRGLVNVTIVPESW